LPVIIQETLNQTSPNFAQAILQTQEMFEAWTETSTSPGILLWAKPKPDWPVRNCDGTGSKKI